MEFAWPQLDILAGALFALAFCALVILIVYALYGVIHNTIGKLPIVGGWIDAGSHKIAQRITNTFGGYLVKIEGVIGASWHSMARMVDKIGHEIAAHAGLLATIATFIPGGGVIVGLYREIALARTLIHKLAHALTGIGHDVVIRTKVIERGIGNDVLPRIRSLDREVGRVISRDIPGLRVGERTLTRELDSLRTWVHRHVLAAGTAAFAGAIAVALAKLGLDWIRCTNARSVFKKRGCNMWNGLESLLATLVDVLLITNMCTVIPWLEEGFSIVAAPLVSTLTTVGAGLCAPGSSPPELLPGVSLHLPAAPDSTLYLG